MTAPTSRSGGRHVRDGSGSGRPAWLVPVVALAALVVVVVLVLVLTGGDEEDTATPATGDGGAAVEDGPAEPGEESRDETGDAPDATAPQAPEGVDADAGALSAGETPVFPLSEPFQDLTVYLDVPVQASAASVESVVGGQGFWLGPSSQERVFVRLVPSEGLEQPLAAGSLVRFTGARFVAHDEGFAAGVGVGPEAGAEQLVAQRAHVEVPAEAVEVVS